MENRHNVGLSGQQFTASDCGTEFDSYRIAADGLGDGIPHSR